MNVVTGDSSRSRFRSFDTETLGGEEQTVLNTKLIQSSHVKQDTNSIQTASPAQGGVPVAGKFPTELEAGAESSTPSWDVSTPVIWFIIPYSSTYSFRARSLAAPALNSPRTLVSTEPTGWIHILV